MLIGRNAAEITDTRVAGAELVLQVRAKGVYFVEDAVPERIVVTTRKLEVQDGNDGLIVGAAMRIARPQVVLGRDHVVDANVALIIYVGSLVVPADSCWCPASWHWCWGGSAADRTPGERRDTAATGLLTGS